MNTSCASQDFPFEYYDVDGEVVNGTLINGSCIFEDANCDPNLPGSDCCDYNPEFTKTMLGSYGSMVNFLPILPVFWIFYRLRQSLSEEERQAMDEEESKKSKPAFIRESKLPEWLKNWLYGVWYFGFGLQIVASIPVMIYLKRTEQSVMSTAQRTTLAAAEAFFEPFYTIFTFVEDIILVRVMYSISSGNKGLTDRLVHMGLAGVTVTGIAGGIVATILGVVPQSVRALTIPGQENDMRLFPGCQFVETVDPSIILPFWLMESWACWGMQLKNVLSGFLIGAEDWYAVGWLGAISIGAFALTWFPFYATFPNPITLLGIAEFIQDWSWPFILWLYLKTWGSGVSERTGLDLSLKKVGRYLLVPFDIMKKKFSKGSNEDDNDDDSDIAATNAANNNDDNDISETQRHQEAKNLIKQGISLMVTDITLEGCKAAAIYLSLLANNAVTYQMTALFSELPQFGLAGILFAKMMLGIFGPMLMAIAHPRFFVEFSYAMLAISLLIIGISVALAIPSNDGLAITSGKNACVFASSTECVPYFNEVMGVNGEGGRWTLFFTYLIFPITIAVTGISLIFRGILLTLLEFDYMLYSTLIAGISFIPAICVVRFAPYEFADQAIAFIAAGLVPSFVLIFLFGVKSFVDLRKVSRGEDGPWAVKQAGRASVVATMETIRLAQKAMATADAEINAADYSNDNAGEDDEKSA